MLSKLFLVSSGMSACKIIDLAFVRKVGVGKQVRSSMEGLYTRVCVCAHVHTYFSTSCAGLDVCMCININLRFSFLFLL